MHLTPFRSPIVASMILLAGGPTVHADWPQLLGPGRDGQAIGESWDAWRDTPRIRWRTPCGGGYAGVAVVDGKVCLWHRESGQELLDCLRVEDGRRLWRAAFPAVYRGGVDPDQGPRAVPVVQDGRVIAFGAAGDLHAVSLDDGKVLWSRELRSDYRADDGYFGAGCSPLVIGSLVIVPVGGADGAGIVAVDVETGETRWKATDEQASYASPVALRIDDQTKVAAVMSLRTLVLEPTSGEVVTRFDFGRRGPVVNAATPLVDGGRLFVTASYGIGCRMVDVASRPPRDLWQSRDVISSQYVTPVRVGDWLYAITGREDMGDADLLCARWDDGEVAWRRPGYGTAHLIAVGDRVVAQSTAGRLDLFAADPTNYRSLAAAELPEGTYRSLPAIADGVIYCRRTISPTQGELLAIEP